MDNPAGKPKVLVAAGKDYLEKLPKSLCPEELPKNIGEFQIITARTLEMAFAHLEENPDIAAVVTTPHIDDLFCAPQAMELVGYLSKAGFKGPIILVSYCQSYRQIFLAGGCTHAADKENALDVLRMAIGIDKH